MNLVKSVYAVSAKFPREEMFGLTAQMRRSAVSVPSNIAEGAGRGTSKEFRQQLVVARGSLSELETQVLIAQELGYATDTSALQHQIKQTFMLMSALIRSLDARTS